MTALLVTLVVLVALLVVGLAYVAYWLRAFTLETRQRALELIEPELRRQRKDLDDIADQLAPNGRGGGLLLSDALVPRRHHDQHKERNG